MVKSRLKSNLMSPDDLSLPSVFGRYVLLRRISRGGMGEIFLAKLGEIHGFEKPIVIKKILPQLASDEEFLRRFIEEAQIAIKLTHGNIVPVYEVGMVSQEYFLALQYIEGRDLRSLISRCRDRRQRMPPDLCLFLVREIANGLAYAHRCTDEAGRPLGLVHCDISPPNILVSYEGEVKIIDFGIAKSVMQRAAANEDVGFGKFGYMAPEQLLRGGVVDRRTDIYSTGVILYELLTGQRVFNFPPGTDYRHVAREVTAGKITPPSDRDPKLTTRFDMLVMRALRTDPRERYQTAEELRVEVQQHLYAMNPTISADALARFVQGLFAEELGSDRSMLRSLSQTDVAPFRSEVHDASSHTVSYALAGLPVAVQQSRPGHVGAAPPSGVSPPGMPKGPPTRRLSALEQAAEHGDHLPPVSQTMMVPRSRRWIVALAAVAAVLVGGAAVWLLRSPPEKPATDPGAGHLDARRPDARRPDAEAASRPSPDARTLAGTPDAAAEPDGRLTFAPEHVHKKAKPRRKHKRHKVVKAAEISATAVQKKFKQVRQEYQQFTRSYGHLLDTEWQQILFANTYDNMDENKYRKLNEMLDSLRRRMKKVREGG
jgi:serine/threonine-protein kinase